MVLALFGLFVPFAFAASLDDPVPKPTIRSELKSGSDYAMVFWFQNIVDYGLASTLRKGISLGATVEKENSQAFQLGYYFNTYHLALITANMKNYAGSDIPFLSLYNDKIKQLLSSLGLTDSDLCECFGIDYKAYKDLEKSVAPQP